jgi:putative hemolysin
MTFTILLIITFLLFILVISGLEYSYLSSNKLNIELKRKKGTPRGIAAAHFFDKPEKFWSITIITYYLILVITCFLISKTTNWFVYNVIPFNFIKYYEAIPYFGIVLDIFTASILIISISGFLSKKIFEYNPEGKLTSWSIFLNSLSYIIQPINTLFTKMAQFTLKYLFNVRIKEANKVFEKVNVEDFVYHSIQGNYDFENYNKDLFDKALRLSKLKIRNCITPRNEIIAVDINAPIQTLKDKFIRTKQSKIVIFDGSLDNIVGYTHHIDLNKKPNFIKDILIEIPVVPETMTAIELMNLFSKQAKSIAWVVDEFGGTAGFSTMEAILEEVFGNLRDEFDITEFTERQINQNEYIFSGRLEINYINKKYNLNIPNKLTQTLSGYIVANHTKIPKLRERLIIDNYEFEILLVTATRVETVRMKILQF